MADLSMAMSCANSGLSGLVMHRICQRAILLTNWSPDDNDALSYQSPGCSRAILHKRIDCETCSHCAEMQLFRRGFMEQIDSRQDQQLSGEVESIFRIRATASSYKPSAGIRPAAKYRARSWEDSDITQNCQILVLRRGRGRFHCKQFSLEMLSPICRLVPQQKTAPLAFDLILQLVCVLLLHNLLLSSQNTQEQMDTALVL